MNLIQKLDLNATDFSNDNSLATGGIRVKTDAASAVGIALAAAIAALPADKYLQGLSSYDAVTNTLVLLMNDGNTVSVSMAGLVSDAVAEALASIDGSETKVTGGGIATVTGTGTSADPYVVSVLAPTGAETKLTATGIANITGTGTAGDPYSVNVPAPAVADGTETKINGAGIATITGSGAGSDPYLVSVPAPTGAETKIEAGGNVTITGTGTGADPYIVESRTSVVTGSGDATVTGTGTTADPYVVAVTAPTPDGSETIVTGSGDATVTGTGTTADPYVVGVTVPVPDGSETVVTGSGDATVTGTGTVADPYVVAVTAPTPDGSETVVTGSGDATVTGTGTAADPYVVAVTAPTPDGSETKVTAGTNVTVTGTGTAADPYVVNATPESVQYGVTVSSSTEDEFGNVTTTVTPADPATDFVGTPVAGDEFFETVDGTQAAAVLNQWVYDGAAWTQRRNHAVYTGTDQPANTNFPGLPGDIYIRTSQTYYFYANAFGREEYLYTAAGWTLTSRDPGFFISPDEPDNTDNTGFFGTSSFTNDDTNLVVPGTRGVIQDYGIEIPGFPGRPTRNKTYVYDGNVTFNGEQGLWRLDSYDPYVMWLNTDPGLALQGSETKELVIGDVCFVTEDGTANTPVISQWIYTGVSAYGAEWRRAYSSNAFAVADQAEVDTKLGTGLYLSGTIFAHSFGSSANFYADYVSIQTTTGNQTIPLPHARVVGTSFVPGSNPFTGFGDSVGTMLLVTDTGDITGTVTEAHIVVADPTNGVTTIKKLPTTVVSGNVVTGTGTTADPYQVNVGLSVTGSATLTGQGNQFDPWTIDVPAPTGAETIVTGTNAATVTGTGTAADPYVINVVAADGSETKVTAGSNASVSGTGTTADPYVVDVTVPEQVYVTGYGDVSVTGSGPAYDPYQLDIAQAFKDRVTALETQLAALTARVDAAGIP